jgi:hypothetical protein
MKSAWQAYTETAEKFNEPGHFTAMIAYEWTSASIWARRSRSTTSSAARFASMV